MPLIAESWLEQQESRKKQHEQKEKKWSGFISPSHPEIKYRMCMDDFFVPSVLDSFLEFEPSQLMLVNGGTWLHKAMEDFNKGLNFKPVNYPDTLKAWYQKAYPEVPGTDGAFKFIADRVVLYPELDHLECIDFKFKWFPDSAWDNLLANAPFGSHRAQVNLCINRLNALKYFDRPIKDGCVLYVNMMRKWLSKGSYHEARWDYMRFQEATDLLAYHLALSRFRYLKGKPVNCKYPYCKKGHGVR